MFLFVLVSLQISKNRIYRQFRKGPKNNSDLKKASVHMVVSKSVKSTIFLVSFHETGKKLVKNRP